MKAIVARNLTKKFGSFVAVDDISFDVDAGGIFGFLGANGAGKSTAIKMLCGLLEPTSGSAKVAGFDISSESMLVKKNIGYMSQKFSLYEDLTVSENINLYGTIYGLSAKSLKEKSARIAGELGMEGFEKKLVASLPLGWKQRLAFAVALVHDPKIVVLDEPTGGVDPIVRRKFWEMIYAAKARGTTVFVTTHYMDEAEYCDKISIMADGKIRAMGSPSELKKEYGASGVGEVFAEIASVARRKE